VTEPLVELSQVGANMMAPLAPAKGSTGQTPGSPVVVIVQSFWGSATIKAFRNMVVGAFGAVVFFVAGQIIAAGGVFGVDWNKTMHAAINAGCVALALAFAAWMKTRDNNPVDKASPTPPTDAQKPGGGGA
jgi:hypothetical protein